jgi:hypothetical protein
MTMLEKIELAIRRNTDPIAASRAVLETLLEPTKEMEIQAWCVWCGTREEPIATPSLIFRAMIQAALSTKS